MEYDNRNVSPFILLSSTDEKDLKLQRRAVEEEERSLSLQLHVFSFLVLSVSILLLIHPMKQ